MADAAISLVLKKLDVALSQQFTLLLQVRSKVEWLRDELKWMECFLEDADAQRRKGHRLVNNWVNMVRDVAHRAEDIIDIFMLNINRRRRMTGITGRIKRYVLFPSEQKTNHKVGVEIEGLRAKIEEIRVSKERYFLTEEPNRSVEEAVQGERQIYPHLADATLVVGLDTHKQNILDQLRDTNTTRRSVISIVGVGGLGKTTLANKIYHSQDITTNFSTRACVWVSQDHNADVLLKHIAEQVMGTTITTEELQRVDINDLRVRLYNFLNERSYFILLDDVWSRDVWNQLVKALPDVNNGSRVLMTTRFTDVARSADPGITPYQLSLLNEDESWELFLRKAFPANKDVIPTCPRHLVKVGRQLTKRCGGLPLELLVLGGLVSTRQASPGEWTKVAERWDETPEGVESSKIMALSYDDLPHRHLRSCFRYLGSFPEVHLISRSHLILLWIAEGFIPHEPGAEMMEDTARAYLDELVQRSMIQVLVHHDDDSYEGFSLRYRVHDIFHRFCVKNARDDGALNVATDPTGDISDPTLRRLAFQYTTLRNANDGWPSSNLRSLLVFGGNVLSSGIPKRLKLLRVIHTEKILEWRFRKEIASMIHLRYLKLQRDDNDQHIRRLPKFIGNLCYLQTLDISETGIIQLPAEILGKMQALRHIYCDKCECPPNIGNLTNLLTIKTVAARGGWIESGGLAKLSNIHDLALSGLKDTQVTVFLNSLTNLERLSSLELYSTELISRLLMTGLSNHNHLYQLSLDGLMSERQLPTHLPANLTALTLEGSKLEQDPMATLEELPNLMFLNLKSESYIGKKMVCTKGKFATLQGCYLKKLEALEDWTVETGAMINLTSLTISSCSSLTMLPEGLQHMKSLQVLYISGGSRELKYRLRPEVGGDWYKIKHVRSVTIKE